MSKQIQVVSSESIANIYLCGQNGLGATHVVTEVKTGFNAILTFDSTSNENMTKNQVADTLDSLVQNLPSEINEGGHSTRSFGSRTAEATRAKEVRKNLKFTFFGDTVVDPPPTTYEDAIQVYKSLPAKSLTEERVVSFSVAPLSDYCNASTFILIEIQSKNVADISKMFMDFKDVAKFFRELKSSKVATDFQRYRSVLLDIEQRYETYRSKITYRIQQALPLIRSNASSEQELVNIVIDYKTSKYEKEEFLGLLYTRKKEIETIEYIVYNPEKPATVLIDFDHTGDMSKCIIENDYTLIYELEVLPRNISHIADEYLNDDLDEKKRWFMSKEKIGLNRPLLATFIRLAKKNEDGEASICFLISLTRDGNSAESNKPFRLQLLKNGELLVDNYVDPEPIWNMEVIDAGYDMAHLRIHHVPMNYTFTNDLHIRLKILYNKYGEEVSSILYLGIFIFDSNQNFVNINALFRIYMRISKMTLIYQVIQLRLC